MWKRAEMSKFLSHLKQKEIDTIEQVTGEWKRKEADRERSFQDTLSKIAASDSRLRQKATELQKREDRIVQLEEELKFKIQETARQLTQKEEEIMQIKVKFKDERTQLEADKKQLKKEATDFQNMLQGQQSKYTALKQEIEDSPLQTLRLELGQKALKIQELEGKMKSADQTVHDYKQKFDLLRREMVNMKK